MDHISAPPPRPAPGLIHRIAAGLQWVVFGFLALMVIPPAIDIPTLGIPNAPPPALTYAALIVAVVIAITHLPPVFFRLPNRAKWLCYAAALGSLILTVEAGNQMRWAWIATPQGAKEFANEKATNQKIADEKAREDARLAVDRELASKAEAAEKVAALDQQKPEMCKIAAQQAVDGEKVLEINNVSVETSTEPNEVLTCSGDAITSRGNLKIEFGFVQTPQGKTLVSIRYP